MEVVHCLVFGSVLFSYTAGFRVLETTGRTNVSNLDEWYIYPKSNAGILTVFSSSSVKVASNDQNTLMSITTSNSSVNASWLDAVVWKRFLEPPGNSHVSYKFSPFEDFLFKINFNDKKTQGVTIKTCFQALDFYNLLCFTVGCVLFTFSKTLSRSTLFHYSSGVGLGLVMSWAIVILLLYKLMPFKRYVSAVILAIGGTGVFLTQKLFDNVIYLVEQYPYHVATGSLTSGLVSLAVLYYYGPPTNVRALNLIQWFLQLSALYLLYQSSYYKQFCITAIIFLCALYFIGFKSCIQWIFKRIFPKQYHYILYRTSQKKKLLTLEEYEEQGRLETQKSLKALAEFCDSPKCNSWEVVSRLKTPKRFAEFLKSGDHLTPEELEAYEDADFDSMLLDGESQSSSFLRTSHVRTPSLSIAPLPTSAYGRHQTASSTGSSDGAIDPVDTMWMSDHSDF